MAEIMLAIFFGHSNPMNAVLNNSYTEGWRRIGQQIPRPKTILSISAHWFVPETAVTISTAPRTIHDFGGFPPELYQIQYPAPGDRSWRAPHAKTIGALAGQTRQIMGTRSRDLVRTTARLSSRRCSGLYLSINETQDASFHFELGKKLALLRDERGLIIGSGNLVHNLHTYAWGRHVARSV